jgi:hypothetical protein
VNRRRSTATVLASALVALTSLTACSTFNRNDMAAQVGDRSVSSKQLEALAATGGTAAAGDALRQELTTWIRVAVLETSSGTAAPATPSTTGDLDARLTEAIAAIGRDSARAAYETGTGGSPLICLAAITVGSIDEANSVLTTLQSGTSFADAARQFSTDATIKEAGGVVKDTNGNECLDPTTVNPAVTAALKGTPVGQPIAADLDTFSAVLMMRPYDELLPESQNSIASASVTQEQLSAIVDAANIYVDPRYGRWDPASGSVVTLSS